MAAPVGNQFWKLRSKHGRDALFASPELLWEAAVEYFEHTDKRKWVKKDWVGKDATPVDRETDTPYTLSALCLYLDCDRNFFNYFKRNCKEDFLGVIARIEHIIYTQKIEGAMVGAFKENIVSRELGLVDKQEMEVAGNINSTVKVEIVKPEEDDEG